MNRLARLATSRPKLVILAWLLVLGAAAMGLMRLGNLTSSGFNDPGAESTRAVEIVEEELGIHGTNVLLLVTPTDGARLDSPAVVTATQQATRVLDQEPGTSIQASFLAGPQQARVALMNDDRTRGLVLGHIEGSDKDVSTAVENLDEKLANVNGPIDVQVGGAGRISLDISSQVGEDLVRAETIAVPLTLALLVIAFGSAVAGFLPVAVGGLAIMTTMGVLGGMTGFTDVSVFALNLASGLGLGLGIDYSLLIVSRFREELAKHDDVRRAVTATLSTAGRTVAFSAATVAIAMSALLVFPMVFLRSFAYAGIAVTFFSAAACLTVLPAALALLGHRVNKFRIGGPRRVGRHRDHARAHGFWAVLSSTVMRRPLLAALPVLALLALMAAPLFGVKFGTPDDRVLPDSTASRQIGDVLRDEFTARPAAPVTVALDGQVTREEISAYASSLSRLEHVTRVDSAAGSFVGGRAVLAGQPAMADTHAAALEVITDLDSQSDEAQDLVRDVRDARAPAPALVGGVSAELVDVKAAIADKLPIAAALIGITTFILLFLFTGSVVIPIKALLINLACIAGITGAMVWVFQEGNGASILGFTPLPLDISMPLLIFCVAFGLSMDYEVFLLARIKELHDAGADTITAVSQGLQRTGRIVTTAALLLAITLFSFTTSQVSFIQMLGLGAGLAIVIDATLVRGILVPALMRMLGSANWWAPAFMRPLYLRFGLSEAEHPEPDEPGNRIVDVRDTKPRPAHRRVTEESDRELVSAR